MARHVRQEIADLQRCRCRNQVQTGNPTLHVSGRLQGDKGSNRKADEMHLASASTGEYLAGQCAKIPFTLQRSFGSEAIQTDNSQTVSLSVVVKQRTLFRRARCAVKIDHQTAICCTTTEQLQRLVSR